MTPDQMTPRQRKRQADVESLVHSTMHVYKPKGAVLVIIDNDTEAYAHVEIAQGLGPLQVAKVLREIAADIEANPKTYETPAGRRTVEYV